MIKRQQAQTNEVSFEDFYTEICNSSVNEYAFIFDGKIWQFEVDRDQVFSCDTGDLLSVDDMIGEFVTPIQIVKIVYVPAVFGD